MSLRGGLRGRAKNGYQNIVKLGELRRCSVCLSTKAVVEFSRNKRSIDGRRSWCKGCCNSKAKGYNAAYFAENRERELARSSEWSTANATHRNQSVRERRLKDPSSFAAYKQNRRARETGGTVSVEDWRYILELHDHRCAYCLVKTGALEMDHVVALARGGDHSAENIVPACSSCNSSKNDKSLLEIFNPRLIVAQRMKA